MTAVFDAPVLTIIVEDLLGGCLPRSFAGDTVSDDTGVFLVFSICYSFDLESLGNMRKIQAAVEFRGDPDPSGLVSAVGWHVYGGMIWLPPNIIEK